jgi:hypothetical protein
LQKSQPEGSVVAPPAKGTINPGTLNETVKLFASLFPSIATDMPEPPVTFAAITVPPVTELRTEFSVTFRVTPDTKQGRRMFVCGFASVVRLLMRVDISLAPDIRHQ